MSSEASPIDVTLRTRVVEGVGALERLGELAGGLGGRALLVTDAHLVSCGHVERAQRVLAAAGVEARLHAEVDAEPTTVDVERCLAAARAFGPDLLIGFGGGSCIDVAKGVNLLLCCGGRMQDYRGARTATAPLLPLIAVPTTAGTGSEMQSFALIAEADSHRKMACGDPAAAPRIALLDPALTLTLPRSVTACTGLDAIAHALETAVTTRRNAVSDELSREAFRLAAPSFPRVLERPDDLGARAGMLRAAGLAGRAIENSMLGAAHALANPLSARYGLSHGLAVGTMLPYVVRFNAAEPGPRALYAAAARSAGLCEGAERDEAAAEVLVATLFRFLELSGHPRTLAAHGVETGACAALGAEAAQQWTASFNPRPVDSRALEALYRGAC